MLDLTYAQLIAGILGTAGVIDLILKTYKSITKPNIKQDSEMKDVKNIFNTEIELLKQSFGFMKTDLHDIRVNHIDHMEEDIKKIREGQIRIETILNREFKKF